MLTPSLQTKFHKPRQETSMKSVQISYWGTCFKWLRQYSCPSWMKVSISSRISLDYLDHELSLHLSAWDVQDKQNWSEHRYWSNSKQRDYRRDSPMTKGRSFIHILLTLDSLLSSLALLFAQQNREGSMCKCKPIHNILTNTVEGEVSQV